MKSFFKYTFATIFGIFLFFLLGILILVMIGASSSDKVDVKDNTVLKINLDRPVMEREVENPFEDFNFPGNNGGVIGLKELKESLASAKNDSQIKGILLEGSMGRLGFAKNEELRAALMDFKTSGKFIYSYGEYFSEASYYTSSVADSIFLNPEGLVEFNGLNSNIMFFKGTLDKLEIKPEIFRVGDFKSAVEPFFRENMSDANRLQANSFLNSINNHNIEQVAKSRNLAVDQVKLTSDSMRVRDAKDAVTFGLVSKLAYYDEVLASLKSKLGLEKDKEVNFISYAKYRKTKKSDADKSDSENKIVVIVAEGDITSGRGDENSIGSDKICETLRKVRSDKKVKAVVLRINSPGGSALASDVMWREIQLLRKEKPVIASMSDVAASGGYYMAMACDKIVAHPNTITGSIGVFGLLFNTKDMFKNKLGVTFDGVKTGVFSDLGNGTRPFTDAERQIIQKGVNQIYETFTAKAAQGRKMSQDDLKKVASGRVWSGSEAQKIGLVDELGGLDKAIELAAAQAKLGKDYRLRYLPTQKSFYQQIMDQISGNEAEAKFLQAELGEIYPIVKQLRELKSLEGIQARLPFMLTY